MYEDTVLFTFFSKVFQSYQDDGEYNEILSAMESCLRLKDFRLKRESSPRPREQQPAVILNSRCLKVVICGKYKNLNKIIKI